MEIISLKECFVNNLQNFVYTIDIVDKSSIIIIEENAIQNLKFI